MSVCKCINCFHERILWKTLCIRLLINAVARKVNILKNITAGADLSNNDLGGGGLDTNFAATPFRSLEYDGSAHFKNLVFDFRVKTIRSSGVARVRKLVGQR